MQTITSKYAKITSSGNVIVLLNDFKTQMVENPDEVISKIKENMQIIIKEKQTE